MKKYPSIEANKILPGVVWAFDKLDGSNIRAEWSGKKRVFYKFASRKQLIDENTQILGEAISIIRSKYEKILSERFSVLKYESVVCFFEFFGAHSFAGQHEDESHDVVLFDIAPYKKGLLHPSQFTELAKDLDIPRVIYKGNMDNEFIQAIKKSTFKELTHEGVVCKNEYGMVKIKTNSWLDAVKKKYGDNEKLLKMLI